MLFRNVIPGFLHSDSIVSYTVNGDRFKYFIQACPVDVLDVNILGDSLSFRSRMMEFGSRAPEHSKQKNLFYAFKKRND